MGLTEILLPDREEKIIGFAGGDGRNYLIEQMANTLSAAGKRILIAALGHQVLPIIGEIVVAPNADALLGRIASQFKQHSILFLGKEYQDHMVHGFSLEEITKLIQEAEYDYFFNIVGPADLVSIFSVKTIQELENLTHLQRLFYCFPASLINGELDSGIAEDVAEFRKNFQLGEERKVLDHTTIVSYLTDPEVGLGALLAGHLPVTLIFTGVESVLNENNVIVLARSLLRRDIQSIYMANLKENLVKPATFEE